MLCLSHNFFLHEILVERKHYSKKICLKKVVAGFFSGNFFLKTPRKPMPPMGHFPPLKNNPLEKAQIATSNLAKILEKYVWRSSFLANLEACRLIASNFSIKWTPSQAVFDSILSSSHASLMFWFKPPPPSNFEDPPPTFTTPVGNPVWSSKKLLVPHWKNIIYWENCHVTQQKILCQVFEKK